MQLSKANAFRTIREVFLCQVELRPLVGWAFVNESTTFYCRAKRFFLVIRKSNLNIREGTSFNHHGPDDVIAFDFTADKISWHIKAPIVTPCVRTAHVIKN